MTQHDRSDWAERGRALAQRCFCLPGGWAALWACLGGAALTAVLVSEERNTPLAYAAYALSGYGLTVGCVAAAAGLRRLWRAAKAVPLVSRCLADDYYRVRMVLRLSLAINLCFAVLKVTYAVLRASFWYGALAVYYISLCVVRLYLLWRTPPTRAAAVRRQELLVYRTAGALLLALSFALSGIAVQIVRDGKSYDYPGALVYAMAAYAFYCMGLAIANAIKYRKFQSPVLAAAKAVSATTALVSLFSLETALVAQFGAGAPLFRAVMTSATATVVCVLAVVQAIGMLIRANRALRGLSPAKERKD